MINSWRWGSDGDWMRPRLSQSMKLLFIDLHVAAVRPCHCHGTLLHYHNPSLIVDWSICSNSASHLDPGSNNRQTVASCIWILNILLFKVWHTLETNRRHYLLDWDFFISLLLLYCTLLYTAYFLVLVFTFKSMCRLMGLYIYNFGVTPQNPPISKNLASVWYPLKISFLYTYKNY